MTTIEAPRVAGRSRARDDIASLGLSRGSTLIVEFPPRSAATPSYLDELVGAVCEELGARVVFRGLSERARIVALESAQRRRVSGLVTIEAS